MDFITTLKANPKIYIIIISLVTTILIMNEGYTFTKVIHSNPISWLITALMFAFLLHWAFKAELWRY